VRNRGQARSRDTMRVEESWGRMGYLYCSTGGTIYRREDPPRADGQGERWPGEAAALGAVTQPIRVRPAARGRQQPMARVAPPQTLMGCGPSGGGSSNPSYIIF
jgi:hypothetical protein